MNKILDFNMFFFFLNIFVREPEVQAPPIPALYFVLFFCYLYFFFAISWTAKDWIACVSECQNQSGLSACLVSDIQNLGLLLPTLPR